MTEFFAKLQQLLSRRKGTASAIFLNAGWLSLAKLGADALSFAIFILLSRHFGVGGIGQFAYGFAVASIAYVFVELGSEDYGVRECSRLPKRETRELVGELVSTQLFVALGALVFVALFMFVRRSSDTMVIVLILSFYQLCVAFARTLFIPALSEESMGFPALAEVASRLIVLIVAATLILGFSASLPIALLGYPMAGLLLLVLASVSALKRLDGIRVRLSIETARRIVRNTWPFLASNAVFIVYARADLIMISWILGDEPAGLYASALKFLEVAIMPLVYLALAAYPQLSARAKADLHAFLQTAAWLVRTSLLLAAFLATCLLFIAPELLTLLLGAEFEPSIPILRAMAAVLLVMGLDVGLTRMLLAKDLQMQRVRLQSLGVTLNILLNLLLIPLFGPLGAVGALLASVISIQGLYFLALYRRVPLDHIRMIVFHFGAIVIAAALVAGGGLLFGRPWLGVLGSIAIFAVLITWTGFATPIWRRGIGDSLPGDLA